MAFLRGRTLDHCSRESCLLANDRANPGAWAAFPKQRCQRVLKITCNMCVYICMGNVHWCHQDNFNFTQEASASRSRRAYDHLSEESSLRHCNSPSVESGQGLLQSHWPFLLLGCPPWTPGKTPQHRVLQMTGRSLLFPVNEISDHHTEQKRQITCIETDTHINGNISKTLTNVQNNVTFMYKMYNCNSCIQVTVLIVLQIALFYFHLE